MSSSVAPAPSSEPLVDASLGSLPTLIVPDDPLTGSIEKPKSPPPSARPEDAAKSVSARATPREPKPPESAPPVDNKPASARTTPRDGAKLPSARDTPQQPPSDTKPVSARDKLPSARDGQQTQPGVTEPKSSTPRVAQDPASPVNPPPTSGGAGDAPVPSSTTHMVHQLSSKDYKGLSKRARALAKLDRLANGNKSVFDANMSDIGALGIGMQLYFMLTKYLAITFLIMGVISLPTIIVHLSGYGVIEATADPLGLAYASLGNQGIHNDTRNDNSTKSLCLPHKPYGILNCTGDGIQTPFTSDKTTVAWIITGSDLAYSGVFFLFFLLYRYRARRAIEIHMNENLTPAKYAVYVRGLPSDATEKEILDHFNTLYDLTKDEEYFPLWLGCCWSRKRRKVKHSLSRNAVNRSVVTNLDHLAGTTSINKELYVGTWIAEVSIGHPTGGLLKTFLSMEALTQRIAETQELITILTNEKTAAPTPTAGKRAKKGFSAADERLLQQSTKTLATLEAKLAAKTGKIKALKATAGVAPTPRPTGVPKDAKTALRQARKAAAATQHAFNWEACECAFVVFNNLESRRRCLQDYRNSTRWLARRFQPPLLRFRNGKYPLTVRPAPEPSNILWENLEVTPRGRFYRRSFTNFVTFLLLLVSCAVISGAQSARNTMQSKMVKPGFCESTLPLVFYGNDSFDDTKLDLDWTLTWDANATCSTGLQNEPRYHIAYTNGIRNELAINNSAPTRASAVRCTDPCISDQSNRTCSSIGCFDQDIADDVEACTTYPERNILFCFCKTAVTESVAKYGVFDGPRQLWDQYIPCRTFITDYLTTNVLLYVAAGIVVVVNLLLKAILRAFATFEAHSSESAKATAIAAKMFFTQFLNTAVIVLVVNAALGLGKIPILSELFKGKYSDFQRDWYPSVGMGITMTMLINAFVPQMVLFAQIYVVAPLMRCIKRRSIRTQEQMNKLYAGPTFDISVRYPMVLNSLCVTMAFSGGSPVLLFIAALTAFGTYWFDKLSILHLYSVKTAYDEELGELALGMLPWTLVLHLGFSMWMYGNEELISSDKVDLGVIFNLLNIEVVDMNGTAIDPGLLYTEFVEAAKKFDILGQHGFVLKVVHTHVLIMFLAFAGLVLGLLLSRVFATLFLPILERTFGVLLGAMWKNMQKSRAERADKKKKASAKVHVDPNPAPSPPPASQPPATATAEIPPDAPPPTGTPDQNQTQTTQDFVPDPVVDVVPKSSAVIELDPKPSPAPSKGLVIPEYTDYFRKTVKSSFRPDKQLGFQKNDAGELIRVWQEETIRFGIKRAAGEPMRTWEAMQAPVKSYAIEMNAKYKLAVAEIVAAAKRMRTKTTHTIEAIEAQQEGTTATTTAVAASTEANAVEAAIAATEPVVTTPSTDSASPRVQIQIQD